MELKIVEWVAQNLHHPVLDRIMVWITHLGDNGYLWVAVCLLLLCYKPTRKWEIGRASCRERVLIQV